MKSSLGKYLVGGVIVVAIAAYAIWSGNSNGGGTAVIPPVSSTPSSGGSATASSGSGAIASTGGAGTPPNSAAGASGNGAGSTSSGQYKNGSYTGPVADAFYGQVQVIATVKNGQLTNIQFPVYPSDPGHSIALSQYALPQLAQEAIAAQSANVNIISGATQTSQAFQQSLGAALAQAH